MQEASGLHGGDWSGGGEAADDDNDAEDAEETDEDGKREAEPGNSAKGRSESAVPPIPAGVRGLGVGIGVAALAAGEPASSSSSLSDWPSSSGGGGGQIDLSVARRPVQASSTPPEAVEQTMARGAGGTGRIPPAASQQLLLQPPRRPPAKKRARPLPKAAGAEDSPALAPKPQKGFGSSSGTNTKHASVHMQQQQPAMQQQPPAPVRAVDLDAAPDMPSDGAHSSPTVTAAVRGGAGSAAVLGDFDEDIDFGILSAWSVPGGKRSVPDGKRRR